MIFKKIKNRLANVGVLGVIKLVLLRLKYYFWDIPKHYLYKIPKSKRDKRKFEKQRQKIIEQERRDSLPSFLRGDYRAYEMGRWILRNVSFLINWPRVIKNRKCKILVVIHIFYMRSVDEVIEYLKNLRNYNYDLVITYIDGKYDNEAFKKIAKYKPGAVFKKYKNIGYDVGPFIDVIDKTKLDDYDIVIKMQTKGTKRNAFVYGQFFRDRDWFRDLWNGVLGSFSVHTTVDKLYKNKRYGVVAAKNLIIHDPKHKQQLVEMTLEKYDAEYVKNYFFVAGSCFAIKSKCLKKIQEMNVGLEDFESSGRNLFSLAHVMERLICFVIMPKYKFYGNKVDFWRHLKWRRLEKELGSMWVLNRIKDLGDFEIDPEYVWLALEHCYSKDVKIENIKISEIKRKHPKTGRVIKLEECEPYLYLLGGEENIKKYKEYCEYHMNDSNLPNMTEDRFRKLVESIRQKGYNKKYPIIIDGNNEICDGHHRACVLMFLHGEDYTLPVIKMDLLTIDLGKARPFSRIVPALLD